MGFLRQLGFFALTLIASAAWAEEAKKEFQLLAKDVYFQPGGGLRVRYENLWDATGGAFDDEERSAGVSHRAQFDFKLYKGEYFETFFRFINAANWGSPNNVTTSSIVGQKKDFNSDNGLLVNQAFATWKIADSLGLKFGRAPIVLGRGLTYGSNDWFHIPYSFDQFDVAWDWDALEFSFIGAKMRDLTAASGDPEENHFIVDVDIKNLTDSLPIFDFHFVQINRDEGSADGGATTLSGLNMQRLGVDIEYKAQQFFLSFFGSYVTGKERGISKSELKIKQTVFDFKAGYLFPESSELKLWAGYHRDSGDDNRDTTDASNTDSKSYDSLYYDVYGQSGLMDFVRWGNLTFYRLGLEANLFTGFNLGAEWLSFQRTEKNDVINFGQAGDFLNNKIQSGDFTLAQENRIGDELDIWMNYKFQSGVGLRATLSAFFPGAAFENGVVQGQPNLSVSGSMYQFLTQLEFFF